MLRIIFQPGLLRYAMVSVAFAGKHTRLEQCCYLLTTLSLCTATCAAILRRDGCRKCEANMKQLGMSDD